MTMPLDILLVDDEPDWRILVRDALKSAGHRVTPAGDGALAADLVSSRPFDLVVSDICLPRLDGLTLFRHVRKTSPKTEVILITGYASVPQAVIALKEGAYDYLTKPLDMAEIVLRTRRIAEQRELERELEKARAQLSVHRSRDLIGSSPVMTRVLDRIDSIAQSDAPVLITGESGTGKEMVARMLHERSARQSGPFVVVNCSAFPETLLEAELFGHERGAFTGATKKREGRFKAADGGTLFLDEAGDIPPTAQAKLLRALQEGTIEPLGTNEPVRVDVRILSATHRNLKTKIGDGSFREDLYYRLRVLDIEIPPLRERRSDLPLLVQHFLTRFYKGEGDPPSITPRAWAALSEHPFPGNVRELEHAIEHAVVLARGHEIDLEHLPVEIGGSSIKVGEDATGMRPLSVALGEYEREYLKRALRVADGKRQRAAEILGISRKNLWEKLRQLGIGKDDDEE